MTSSSSSTPPVFPLSCGVQTYDWGKVGSNSKAAVYGQVSSPGFEIDEKKPYAEVRFALLLPFSLLASFCPDPSSSDRESSLGRVALDGNPPFLPILPSIFRLLCRQPQTVLAHLLGSQIVPRLKSPRPLWTGPAIPLQGARYRKGVEHPGPSRQGPREEAAWREARCLQGLVESSHCWITR
jgi:hypothetical protein